VKAVLAAGADWIHFDVMDNHYVRISPSVRWCARAAQGRGQGAIDVHLMVSPVDCHGDGFRESGRHQHQFPPEATLHVDGRSAHPGFGCSPGWYSTGDSAQLAGLRHRQIDLVLLMSVNPVRRAKIHPEAMPSSPKRAPGSMRAAATSAGDRRRVKIDNAAAIAKAGADTFVADRHIGRPTTPKPSGRCGSRSRSAAT